MVIATALLGCVLWAVVAGKGLTWDLANYHLYGPYNLLHHRLGIDFMAASVHGYINPLAHVPFYAMVMGGWHSVAIAAALALSHALALVLIYLIARSPAVFGAELHAYPALIATALSTASVVFWLSVGKTYTDITTATFVLAAVLVFVRARSSRAGLSAAVIGVLLGIATGLKLTNAIYAVAGAVLPWWLAGDARGRLRAFLLFVAGGIAGWILSAGYWAFLLWREFGNPLFPWLNNLFRSPDFPPVSLLSSRFAPRSLLELLQAPLRMLEQRPEVYSEALTPDIRFALLTVALVAWGVRSTLRRPPLPGVASALPALAAYFVLAFVLWASGPFNARYGMPLMLLVGVVLTAVLRRLLPLRAFILASLACLLLQGVVFLDAAPLRWSPAEPWQWTQPWIDYRLPDTLRGKAVLYASLESPSYSLIAPFVGADSAFVNLRGQYTLGLEGPGAARLQALMRRYEGRLRMFARAPSNTEGFAEWLRVGDEQLLPFGLAIAPDDCLFIRSDLPQDGLSRFANRLVGATGAVSSRPFITCALRHVAIPRAFLEARAAADAVFASLERSCPRLFPPGLARSEHYNGDWVRNYLVADQGLSLRGNEVLWRPVASAYPISLGASSEWLAGRRGCPPPRR